MTDHALTEERPAPTSRSAPTRVLRAALAGLGALALPACAGTTRFVAVEPLPDSLSAHAAAVLAHQELLEHQIRVDAVARRLVQALPTASPGDSSLYVGLRLADPLSDRAQDALADAVGVVAPVRPFVVSVDPSGPAANADVLPGDQILAVGDEPVRDVREIERALERTDREQPVALRLFRDGRQHDLEVTGDWRPDGLDVRVVSEDQLVNAFARREGILLPTGMLRFLRNDHELAVVLGHEIGHVLRGHLSSTYTRGRFDARFVRDLEREADRYALELAEQAGYNPAAAISVWQRFARAVRRPFSREWLSTHPPSRERVLTARRLALELRPRQILRAILPRLPLRPS